VETSVASLAVQQKRNCFGWVRTKVEDRRCHLPYRRSRRTVAPLLRHSGVGLSNSGGSQPVSIRGRVACAYVQGLGPKAYAPAGFPRLLTPGLSRCPFSNGDHMKKSVVVSALVGMLAITGLFAWKSGTIEKLMDTSHGAIATCEATLLKQLRSPSTYNRISVEYVPAGAA
jgi:hypothetical protein